MSVNTTRIFLFLMLLMPLTAQAKECVILLHGLARTEKSMSSMEEFLAEAGYTVINVSYPSRAHPVEDLAGPAIAKGLTGCATEEAETINFVVHSLGGILLRYYLKGREIEGLNRVVMLGTPNQGSEASDSLRVVPGFKWLNGEAGLQLGTDENSLPRSLGPASFELGIIAGNKTIDPFTSQFLPNPDDGRVSVVSTRLEGMCAFVELPVSHAFMMSNDRVMEETLSFLMNGEFTGETAENGLCKQEAGK